MPVKWLDYVVLCCAFFLIVHTLDAPGGDPTQVYGATAGTGTISKQIGFVLLLAYGAFALIVNWDEVFRFKTASVLAATSFLCIIVLSVAWSIDLKSSVTRLFGFFVYIFAAAGAVKRLGARDVVKWYVFAQSTYLLGGLVNELRLHTFQPLSGAYRFSGLADDNATGNDAAVLIFASVAMMRLCPSETKYRWSLGLAVVVLLLTRSRTALLSAAMALLLTYCVVRLRGLWLSVCLVGLTLFGGSLFVSQQLNLFSLQGAVSLGREDASTNEALNGRTPLWAELYDGFVTHRPLIGYGYGAFWTPERITSISEDQGWSIAAAHSIYIDALLAVGFPGALLYVATLLILLIRAIRLSRAQRPEGFLFSCLLCAMMIDGFSDSEPWFVSSIYLFAAIQAVFVLNAGQDGQPKSVFATLKGCTDLNPALTEVLPS